LPDRPAHILEIPESLGRDVDRYRAGQTDQAPPVEAFMSEDSLNQMMDATRAETVRQQDLVPITAGEARQRTTFDGEHLPSVPSLRRVIPEPFRRERVSLDRHGRAWQETEAQDVEAGDVVPDVGRIVSTEIHTRYATVAGMPDVAVGMDIILTGIDGTRHVFAPGCRVRAFRRAG
jgi:hypothetical protein